MSRSESRRGLRSRRTFSTCRIILNLLSRMRIPRTEILEASAGARCPTEPYSLGCTCISEVYVTKAPEEAGWFFLLPGAYVLTHLNVLDRNAARGRRERA